MFEPFSATHAPQGVSAAAFEHVHGIDGGERREESAARTAACAVAVASILRGVADRDVTVALRGGDLRIEWEADDASVFMTGPAAEVFTGTFPFEEA